MKGSPSEPFPPDAARKLKWYVYSLIDPRNAEALGPFLMFSTPLSAVMLMVASHDQTCPRKEL